MTKQTHTPVTQAYDQTNTHSSDTGLPFKNDDIAIDEQRDFTVGLLPQGVRQVQGVRGEVDVRHYVGDVVLYANHNQELHVDSLSQPLLFLNQRLKLTFPLT